MRHNDGLLLRIGCGIVLAAVLISIGVHNSRLTAQTPPAITISSMVPSELNAASGGAPNATPDQAAAFAWQEFIALNWPAGPQQGLYNQRDTPSASCKFGDPTCPGPTVWQTFRGKVETFPGQGNPPGYPSVGANDKSYGYDALPQYNYLFPVTACNTSRTSDPIPWVNLDETDQITLDSMYAGVVSPGSSSGNSAPQLIRFLAKSNRTEYVYVAENSSATNPLNQWWSSIPAAVVTATETYIAKNMASPPAGSSMYVSQPYGTIEVKSAWRALDPSEAGSGRFHMQRVRFYEHVPNTPAATYCYIDATWGMVALHIIQKTPSAPYFIYATFEQADNLLTAAGKPVEDTDGNVLKPAPPSATTPQVCLQDPKPKAGQGVMAMVVVTADPKACVPIEKPAFCDVPGKRLYYRNENEAQADPPPAPIGGNICVDKRDNDIPPYAIAANKAAHSAMSAYLKMHNIKSAPWLYYKLVNVQYFPYDKIITPPGTPNGSLYTSKPPYTAANPAASSFYQANIVVETNRALQLFSGGLTLGGNGVSTDWNNDGSQHVDTYYNGKGYTAGGCLGCHGSQGQNPMGKAGDFSVILARGSVPNPEYPAQPTATGMTVVPRNRILSQQIQYAKP
jgi:hypothetical protein